MLDVTSLVLRAIKPDQLKHDLNAISHVSFESLEAGHLDDFLVGWLNDQIDIPFMSEHAEAYVISECIEYVRAVAVALFEG